MNSILEEDSKYDHSIYKYRIEKEELDLRKKLHLFEFSTRKTKEKIFNFQKNEILNTLDKLKDYKRVIRGFNSWAFLLGLSSVHMFRIYKYKLLLYEMRGIILQTHVSICLGFGLFCGLVFGYSFSSSFSLYLTYRKVNKSVNEINNDFEKYYIKNEEEYIEE
jgi:hypothetical protein